MSNQPTDQEVRAALQRVLSSPGFVRSRRAQGFLRFVTEETLAGRARTVSGYAIAVDVFGKPVEFDAAADPLVRVEAGRVRARLRDYYATTGRDDSVRIEVHVGNYVPTFTYASPRVASERPRRARLSPAYLLVPAVLALAVVGVLIGGVPPSATFPDNGFDEPVAHVAEVARHGAPRILVEPFRNVGDAGSPPLALGLTEEVMVRLGRYSEVKIFAGRGDDPGGAGTANVDVDYELTALVRGDADTIHVVPQLVDAHTGQRIWSEVYEEPFAVDAVWRIVDAVAGAVTRAVGEPYGPLFDTEVARAMHGEIVESTDPHYCLLRFVFALEVISEGAHGRATACFERAVVANPDSSMSWARLAALYRMEYLHDFNTRDDSKPPLERAAAATHRALSLDQGNAFAHQEMAFLSLLRDDTAGFEKSVARVLALDPSADLRTALGINFVKIGQAERGFALMDQGLAESPRAPPFFFLGYAVHALRMHDYEAAFAWAERTVTPDWPLSQALLAAVAALTGRDERAHEAAQRLLELRPAFAETGREVIARGRLGPEVDAELARGLALAGIELR